MSKRGLSRRAVLLGLSSLVPGLSLPLRRAAATPPAAYALLRYSVGGSMVEEIDASAGRYRVLITGSRSRSNPT